MSKKFVAITFSLCLPLIPIQAQVLDDDSVLGQDVSEAQKEQEEEQGDPQATGVGAGQDARQETSVEVDREEEQEAEGEVIKRDSKIINREGGELKGKEFQEGSADVQYTTKKQITKTLQQEESIPTIQICESKANINEMQKEDWLALGFDKKSAEAIVQEREKKGEFKSVEELSKVKGISQSTFSKVKQDLGVAQRQAEEAKPESK